MSFSFLICVQRNNIGRTFPRFLRLTYAPTETGNIIISRYYLPGTQLHAIKDYKNIGHSRGEGVSPLFFGILDLKAALDLLGYYGGDPRSPLSPPSSDQIEEIRSILEETGLLA
jgi:hypothetical protein